MSVLLVALSAGPLQTRSRTIEPADVQASRAVDTALSSRVGPLRVSSNGRYLVHADGSPFFWLGDTAWELFHRLDREEAAHYLENRREKGFTVVQAVVIAELDGLGTPNPYGHTPLLDRDPSRPDARYFEHVDFIVRTAAEKGIYIAMLPTWGDTVMQRDDRPAPIIFNRDTMRVYGEWLGRRYRDAPNIIWVVGGDRDPSGVEDVWRALAEGLGAGDDGAHLRTFHPNGRRTSADWFHGEPWLDFNMVQSGHNYRDNPNWEFIRADYLRTPAKPVLDAEPRYENHPVGWRPYELGWFEDYDVRQAAYWALFAGAFGHTYGCHDVWQMAAPGRPPVGAARGHWRTSLDLPGAFQMTHVRRLMESRPMLERVPDQGVVIWRGTRMDFPIATRGADYLFAYTPAGRDVIVRMGRISGAMLNAWWYDPRSGRATALPQVRNEGVVEFDPPGTPDRGNDWVLVLDDASRNYPPPGQGRIGR